MATAPVTAPDHPHADIPTVSDRVYMTACLNQIYHVQKKKTWLHILKSKQSKKQNTYRLSGLMALVINFSVPAEFIGILIGVSLRHWFLTIRKTTNTNHM